MATTVAIVPSHHHEAFVFAMTTCVIGVSQHVLLLLFGGKIKVVRSEKVFRNRRFNFSCASNYSVPLPKIRRRVCKLGGNGQTYGMKFGMKLVSETRERTR